MRSLTVITLLAVLATALTGCIETPDAVDGASAADAAPTADERRSALAPHAADGGRMTAEESVTESSGRRGDAGFALPAFFAERVVTVEGMLDLARLPVVLATWHGDVTVSAGPEGAWALVATVNASGWTEADARENLERVTFTWSHTTEDGYFLRADAARTPTASLVPGANVTMDLSSVSADLALTVPASLLVDLVATTRDGDVEAFDVRATGLFLEARDGDVRAHGVTADVLRVESRDGDVRAHAVTVGTLVALTRDGDVRVDAARAADVVAETRDGDVDVDVTPTGHGALTAVARDGDVTVRVPESTRHGYDATLATRDGDVDVRLGDGTSRVHQDGDAATGTFRSNGYDDRATRTVLTLETRDGDVTLRSA